jgi:hypothetical protein
MRILLFYAFFATSGLAACNGVTHQPATQNVDNQAEPVLTSNEVPVDKPADTAQPAAAPPAVREHPAPTIPTDRPVKETKPSLPEKRTGETSALNPGQSTKSPEPTAGEPEKTPVVISQPVEKQPVAPTKQEPAPAPKSEVENPKPEIAAPSHEAWDKLLQQYVSAAGKVNYEGFKKDKSKLEAYLETLKKNPPQAAWSNAEKMAFWINAYNAFTIKLIVDNYPLASITKLDGGKPWDVKRISIGDKTYSLNNIENDILRPQFKDARIHFAVNCAAKSCPPLLNRAWTAANLEANFEKQAKAFINNPQFNKISEKSVEVSKIFEWYAADFGNLVAYLNKYAATKINANAKIAFKEYDWGLNQG